MERRLITDYETVIGNIIAGLSASNYDTAIELAEVPEHIRGYGHVKERHVKLAKDTEAKLMAKFRDPSSAQAPQAAE